MTWPSTQTSPRRPIHFEILSLMLYNDSGFSGLVCKLTGATLRRIRVRQVG